MCLFTNAHQLVFFSAYKMYKKGAISSPSAMVYWFCCRIYCGRLSPVCSVVVLKLLGKEIIVWNFIENIAKRIFGNQCECIENIRFDLLKDVVPIFIQKSISAIAEQFVAVV